MRSNGMIAATFACSLSGCLDTKSDTPAPAVDAGAWSAGAGSVKPPLAEASAGSAWLISQAGTGGPPPRSAQPLQPMAAGGQARGQAGAAGTAGGRRMLPVVRASSGDSEVLDAGTVDAGALDAGTIEVAFDAGEPTSSEEQPEGEAHLLATHLGDLVITELMIDPKALPDAEGEWIELYNATDSLLELRDCQLDDGADSLHEIPAVLVEAGAYVTIAREPMPGFAADLVVPLSLTNSADSVAIVCQGQEIDRVSYDEAAELAIASGASLALDPSQLDASANDAASAWCEGKDAYAEDLGSPGHANPSCHEAEPPEEEASEPEPHDAGISDAGSADAGEDS